MNMKDKSVRLHSGSHNDTMTMTHRLTDRQLLTLILLAQLGCYHASWLARHSGKLAMCYGDYRHRQALSNTVQSMTAILSTRRSHTLAMSATTHRSSE